MAVTWPDDIDEILGGDLAAGLAYATPANGVVITPMAPLGLRNREAGTVTLTTSLGLWKKVARIRANPSVAIAYHAREHGDSDRPEFVLVQGRASIPELPDRAWLESITPQWERFLGPRKGGLTGRLMDVYYWNRVPIVVAVERVVAFADERCADQPSVYGSPLPAEPPPPQREPRNGTGPRTDSAKLATWVQSLPHTLLGWIGADGLPVVVGATATGAGPAGAELDVAPELLPPGGRRAGLTSHMFRPRMVGQEQRIFTGWLAAEGNSVRYAPHTHTGYRLPASQLAFELGSAFVTRSGLRAARKAGVAG